MLAARLRRTAGRRLRRGRRGTGEVLEKHLTVGFPRGQHALARGGQRHARHGTGVDIPLVQTRAGERLAAIGREQREDVPVDLLRRRTIEQVQPALAPPASACRSNRRRRWARTTPQLPARSSRRRPSIAPATPAARLPRDQPVTSLACHATYTVPASSTASEPPPSMSNVCVVRFRCGSKAVRCALDLA